MSNVPRGDPRHQSLLFVMRPVARRVRRRDRLSDPAATMILDDATRIVTEVDIRPLEPGVLLDHRYRIMRLLGRGGMG